LKSALAAGGCRYREGESEEEGEEKWKGGGGFI
jgi:hypothetical protein